MTVVGASGPLPLPAAATAATSTRAAGTTAAALRQQRVVVVLVVLLRRGTAGHVGRDHACHHVGVGLQIRLVQHLGIGAVTDAEPQVDQLQFLVHVEPRAAARLGEL